MSDRKQVEAELQRLAEQVELRNTFIRETFGRYLTDEVVSTVLESPTGLKMGGEKRKVTMLMTDLRGFTSLSERLPPERVVALLNRYLTTMVTVIKQYQGTIDEFIGDAIFVLFGAPVWQEDDANGPWPARWRCSSPWPRSTNRTGKKICPSSRWASGFIPARWWWGISARPSG